MFTMLLADGLTSGLEERITTFIIKCLAVAGGFIAGYVLGWIIGWALNRWALKDKAPEPLRKAISIVCGVALALLVALFVFGDGGGGLFGHGKGGGEGKGTDAPADEKGKQPPPKQDDKKDVVPPPKKPIDITPPKPADVTITVTVLGGTDVMEAGKYYLIDGDTTPKNLAAVEQAVKDRKAKAGKESTVGITINLRATNRPPLDPEAESITDLRRLAEKLQVGFTIPPKP